MQVTLTFLENDKQGSQETFTLKNLLGKSKFAVYTIKSRTQQAKYALKLFPTDTRGQSYYEKENFVSTLQHPNIIKSIPITCDNNDFQCLLTEFAPFGDFLKLTMNNAFQSETLVRTYFRQLIEGIEYLHSQGVAHLDLKLDNLVLGSDYKLKIIDFDQAQLIKDTKIRCGGSPDYRPPEVIDRRCKNMTAVDIYSAGIILYTWVAKEFPFHETTDPKGVRLQHYSTFVKDKTKFWEMKAARQQEKNVFSEDLIELLNGMFDYNVEKRFKLEDIKQSKWYQGLVVEEQFQ